ncbi:MAG: hypothetical protein JO247_14060, partial [Chloroflexi bacterium]|nr:hypothetical protein [Chloroflexota bacterium]
MNRREFLGLALVGSASALLVACGTAAAPSSAGAAPASGSGGGSAAAKPASDGPYPTYLPPANGPKPDFQDPDPRYDLGFNNYPANPVKSWTKAPPGTGARVDILNQAYFPTFTPLDSNPTWKEVNKQLNADA